MLYQGHRDYILNQQEAKPKWITIYLVLNDTEVNVVALNANSIAATNKEKKHIETIGGAPWFNRVQNERNHLEGL